MCAESVVGVFAGVGKCLPRGFHADVRVAPVRWLWSEWFVAGLAGF